MPVTLSACSPEDVVLSANRVKILSVSNQQNSKQTHHGRVALLECQAPIDQVGCIMCGSVHVGTLWLSMGGAFQGNKQAERAPVVATTTRCMQQVAMVAPNAMHLLHSPCSP